MRGKNIGNMCFSANTIQSERNRIVKRLHLDKKNQQQQQANENYMYK